MKQRTPNLVELGQQLQTLALVKDRDSEWVKQFSTLGEQINERIAHVFAQLPAGAHSKCYAYGRISPSDDKDPKNSLSIQSQEWQHKRYFDDKLAPHGVQWGDFYSDDGVSAFKKRFLLRPKASIINSLAQRGDHILFLRMDRAFRGLSDFGNVYRLWEARGINIHFVQEGGIDYTTAMGKFILQIRAGAAELESACQSERRKAVNSFSKANGFSGPGRWVPYGKKKVPCGNRHRLVNNPEERAIMQQIVRLRETCQKCGHRNTYTEKDKKCVSCGASAYQWKKIARDIHYDTRKIKTRAWYQKWNITVAFRAEKELQLIEAQATTQNGVHQLHG